MIICQVCTTRAILDYKCPDHLTNQIDIAKRVVVPLLNTQVVGIITDIDTKTSVPTHKLRELLHVLDEEPIMLAETYQLFKWLSNYYKTPLQYVINAALPKNFFKQVQVATTSNRVFTVNNHAQAVSLSLTQERALQVIAGLTRGLDEQSRYQHHISVATLEALCRKGAISTVKRTFPRSFKASPFELTAEQQRAIADINSVEHNNFHCFLLFGVTGSGKTEVYCEIIKKVLSEDGLVLVLVPEINLAWSAQQYYEERLNIAVDVLHSELLPTQRMSIWLNHHDNCRLIVSTRLGILGNLPNLKLIIIDEEHDPSYKQQSGELRYHARNVAIYRAWKANIPIILGSASPSSASLLLCDRNKCQLVKIDTKVTSGVWSLSTIVDMNKEKKILHGLSATVLSRIQRALDHQQQTLIFLNNVGFAKKLICEHCSWTALCRKCERPYLYFALPEPHLLCRVCKDKTAYLVTCPICNHPTLDKGIGTEKIEAHLQRLFPQASVARIDFSTKNAFPTLMKDINEGKVDIMIGTQIITKGHNFKNIGLVIIMDIDACLYSKDWGGIERSVQLVYQCSGRTGRFISGEVLIQTYKPAHLLFQHIKSGSYLECYRYLLDMRRQARLPPCVYLAYIYGEHQEQTSCYHLMSELSKQLNNLKQHCDVADPLPCLKAKSKGLYRYYIALTSDSNDLLHATLHQAVQIRDAVGRYQPKKWNFYIDLDPIGLT